MHDAVSVTMNLKSFSDSLKTTTPPKGLSAALLALWHAARGDWEKAHRIVQDDGGTDAAWVHAFLHRKEGDRSNASYWYSRAGKEPFAGEFDAEWQSILTTLLRDPGDPE
jgi:hypothetical protein